MTSDEIKIGVATGEMKPGTSTAAAAALLRQMAADMKMVAEGLDSAASTLTSGDSHDETTVKAAVQIAIGRRAMEEALREAGEVFDAMIYVASDLARK